MECFESVVVAGGQGGRFQPVCDKWYEDCVVNSELPLECEVCVAPELVKRVEVLAGLNEACCDVLVGGAVAAEGDAKVLGMLLNCDWCAVCERDGVV